MQESYSSFFWKRLKITVVDCLKIEHIGKRDWKLCLSNLSPVFIWLESGSFWFPRTSSVFSSCCLVIKIGFYSQSMCHLKNKYTKLLCVLIQWKACVCCQAGLEEREEACVWESGKALGVMFDKLVISGILHGGTCS